jgi:hypothetical protein
MIKRLVLLAILAVVGEARAYEQATHAAITEAAYVLSDLGIADAATIPPLVRTLGLDGFAPLGDGRRYFEFIGSPAGLAPFERTTQQYEQGILRSLDVVPGADPLLTWLMYGAIREDDNASEDPATPQDVAPGVRRPLNHFFDPYFNRPLTAPALLLIDSDVHKNPDWAIGARDSFRDPNTPESPRRNSFSVFDAREAMFRALTLMTSNGSEFIDLSAGLDQARRQQARQAYWATAFRALGDVLHLNQDMAQPQHTRNEPHSGALCPSAHICLTGHTSVYEKYLNARNPAGEVLRRSAVQCICGDGGRAVAVRSVPDPRIHEIDRLLEHRAGRSERNRQGPCRLQQPRILHCREQPRVHRLSDAIQPSVGLCDQDDRTRSVGWKPDDRSDALVRVLRHGVRHLYPGERVQRSADVLRTVGSVPGLVGASCRLHAQSRAL